MSQSIAAVLPAQTAGGAVSTTYAGVVSSVQGTNNAIRKAWITAPAGMSTATANATNNVTVEIGRTRAGARVVVASFTSTTTSIVAGTPVAIPVATTKTAGVPDASSVLPGDLIDVKLTQNASGVALAAGCAVSVEVE